MPRQGDPTRGHRRQVQLLTAFRRRVDDHVADDVLDVLALQTYLAHAPAAAAPRSDVARRSE